MSKESLARPRALTNPNKQKLDEERRARLAKTLRENLFKRKAQMRARKENK